MPNLIFPFLALLGFTVVFIIYHYTEKRNWRQSLKMRILELQRTHNNELDQIEQDVRQLSDLLEKYHSSKSI